MSRTRSKIFPSVVGVHKQIRHNTGDPPAGVVVLTKNTTLLSGNQTIVDTVTPRFRERFKAGEIINNSVLLTKTSVLNTSGGSRRDLTVSNGNYTDFVGDGNLNDFMIQFFAGWAYTPLVSSLNVSDLTQQAQQRALANLDRAPYSVAEDLATIRETVKFIRRPMGSLLDLAKRWDKQVLKRSGRTNSLRRAKLIADAWTEYRFAFKPLMKTVQTVYSSLTDSISVRPARLVAHGYSEGRYTFGDVQKVTANEITWSRKIDHSAKYHAAVIYMHSNPVMDWRDKYGLRVKDIPELWWDLVPLSFVVDRVFDVGTGLRALSAIADPELKILGGSVTSRNEKITSYSYYKEKFPATRIVTIVPDLSTTKTYTYQRTVWQPSVLDVVPPILPGNLVKDLTSIADVAALIVQRLR
jgi:hypothetical protein